MMSPSVTKGRQVGAPQGTQAVIRAVSILKYVSAARRGVSLEELCSALGISKPTTHRIVSALISEGLVTQDPASRAFRMGPAAKSLGAHSVYRPDLRALARPILASLAARSGESATLEVPVGSDMLILDEVEGDHIIGARSEIGARWPMHATSTGKAVLAALAPGDMALIVNGPLQRLTPRTLADSGDLTNALKVVRKEGFATAVGELQPDFTAVGVAVRDSMEVVAALSIGGPSERLPRKRLGELGRLLSAAANELSMRLSPP